MSDATESTGEIGPWGQPRVGSLCMGIGGLDLAVEQVYGGELVWYSEIEASPCVVVEREWPGVPNLGDLTALDWAAVEPIDILTAGYPCQPFSQAGKRKGASDARHLWPFIAEAVRVLRPRRVVLENVRGHLSLGFGTVLGDLAEAGFDAEWCLLRASDVGAPHGRARVFVVAADARGERHGSGQDGRALGRVDREDAGQAWQRERARPLAGDRDGTAPADANDGRRGQHHAGLGRLPEPDALGEDPAAHALVYEPRPVGRDSEKRCERERVEGATTSFRGIGPATDANEAGLQGWEPTGRRLVSAWGDYEPAIRRWEHVLGRSAPAPTNKTGQLDPIFVEWMMGYPAGWTDGLPRTKRLKALGNAVVPQQGAAAIAALEPCGQPEVATCSA